MSLRAVKASSLRFEMVSLEDARWMAGTPEVTLL